MRSWQTLAFLIAIAACASESAVAPPPAPPPPISPPPPPANPAPSLVDISPTSRLLGDTAFTLTATGTNFVQGSEIYWGGVTTPTIYVSSTELRAQIAASALTIAGSVGVTVVSQPPGGGTSEPRAFTVLAAPPGLHILSGTEQAVQPGVEYPVLLEVVLRDADGWPAPDVAVRYQGPGASTWSSSGGWPPRTDSLGRVAVRWQAPTDGTKDFIVTAIVEGAEGFSPSTVQFSLSVLPVTSPTGLRIVAGNNQAVLPGEVYPILLQTELRDAAGVPAANITVRYQGLGLGSWEGESGWPPRTDSQGRVAVRWSAPSDGTSDFTVTALVEGATGFSPSTAQFSLSVLPITPQPGLRIIAGNNQMALSGETYQTLLVTELRDAAGVPAANVIVRYQGPGTGAWVGGSGWPPRTDSQGRVAVQWWAPTDGAVSFVVTATVEGAEGFSPSSAEFPLLVGVPGSSSTPTRAPATAESDVKTSSIDKNRSMRSITRY